MNNQVFFKILTVIIIVSVLIGGIWYWWHFGRPEVKVKLNQEFRLKVNQIAFIESENIKIKFLDGTEDSRCPSGVVCFWEGQVVVSVNIIKDAQEMDFNLTLRPRIGEGDLAVKDFDGYSIKLVNVEPYPESGVEIKPSEYIASFIIEKI